MVVFGVLWKKFMKVGKVVRNMVIMSLVLLFDRLIIFKVVIFFDFKYLYGKLCLVNLYMLFLLMYLIVLLNNCKK